MVSSISSSKRWSKTSAGKRCPPVCGLPQPPSRYRAASPGTRHPFAAVAHNCAQRYHPLILFTSLWEWRMRTLELIPGDLGANYDAWSSCAGRWTSAMCP